ncbi:hypothetical protein HYX01_01050 [Candidatus Woesearchaeota archaeon]|nr:hypothetical protein [Candidatus Woesearchaeota archaeon]
MLTEKLFSAIDETKHAYTWDYTTREAAIALFDANEEYFAMITKRREIADETGAMLDYRDNTYYVWNLYSKNNLETGIKPVEKWGKRERHVLDDKTRKMVEVGKEDLMGEVKKKPYGTDIKELESITLRLGRVYILDGNLMLDRTQSQ